jgi:hypothetical protein
MDVLPSHSEAPSGIEESTGVDGERSGNRKRDREFSQGVNCAVEHHTDQAICDDERRRSTGFERSSRTDEKTSA